MSTPTVYHRSEETKGHDRCSRPTNQMAQLPFFSVWRLVVRCRVRDSSAARVQTPLPRRILHQKKQMRKAAPYTWTSSQVAMIHRCKH